MTDPINDGEQLARQFFDRVWSSGHDLSAIDQLMTEDYVIRSAGQMVRGRPAFRAWVQQFQSDLLDATTKVEEVFADSAGDRVVARWTCSGRSNGIFGLPADGRSVSFTGIAVWSIRAGRLAECWVERSALEAVRES